MTQRTLTTLTAAVMLVLVGCTDEQAAPENDDGPKRIALEGALTTEQGLAALNENIPTVAVCTKGASDPYVIMMSWTVLPDGSVTKVEVGRQGGELDAKVKECLVAAMKKWSFPKSRLGTRIEQIPLKVGAKG